MAGAAAAPRWRAPETDDSRSVTRPPSSRIALLSDIHGNSTALDAVLSDIEQQGGADAFWVLGDLVALGPDPVGVLERLARLPNLRWIRGNTDRYATLGDRPEPTIDDARADPSRLSALVEVANTFAWTQGMITASGWLGRLSALPIEMRSTLPDGTRFLGVHASPGRDDGDGIGPGTPVEPVRKLLRGCEADLVCVGHTHLPSRQTIDGIDVVGLGAVSLSRTPDKASSYVLLDLTEKSHAVRHRRIPYDRCAVIAQLEDVNHPARGFLIRLLADA